MKLNMNPHSKNTPGAVRIIGGAWRKSLLGVPPVQDLRPTPNRIRETLFNWLGQDLTGWACADVFAGTGALGFEAASRGAHPVYLFESNPAAFKGLQANRSKLRADQLQLKQGDGLALLQGIAPASLDLIFLDPPFRSASYERLLGLSLSVLKPRGWLYLESDQAWEAVRLQALGYHLHRQLRAGQVHAHLLQPVA
jgi:16S rRNA (guanine(966)-N(2))-methyltransferase RsmD